MIERPSFERYDQRLASIDIELRPWVKRAIRFKRLHSLLWSAAKILPYRFWATVSTLANKEQAK